MVFDTSMEARNYTDELLKEKLAEKGIEEYTIHMTSGGFTTDDPVIYLVAYRYTWNDTTEVYGYKLKKDDVSGFQIIEEGEEVGTFILSDSSDETEASHLSPNKKIA